MTRGRYTWPVPVDDGSPEWVAGVLDGMDEPYNVLDPAAGPGTVLYECGKRGWKCTGLEGDPLMRWIATARSRRFRRDAAELAGYAWERVADDVFWESEGYRVPELVGTLSYGPRELSFLRRVRLQIDRETDEGINDLLRLALCVMLFDIREAKEFDDTVGMGMFASALSGIGGSLEPNPERGQTVHLADGRHIPPVLRDSYDAVVSVVPGISPSVAPERLRTMCQWIGFTDLERRDSMCVGAPLGDAPEQGSVPETGGIPADLLPDGAATGEVVRWFADVRDLALSAAGAMSSSAEGRFLVRDETVGGAKLHKSEILAQLLVDAGVECRAEGSGDRASVVFRALRKN